MTPEPEIEEAVAELRWNVEESLAELNETVARIFDDRLDDLRHCIFHQIAGRVGWRILLDGWIEHSDWACGTDGSPRLAPFTYYLGEFVDGPLESAKAFADTRLKAVHKHLWGCDEWLDDGESKILLEWHDYRSTPVIRRRGPEGVIRGSRIVWRPEKVTETDRVTAKLKIGQLWAEYSEEVRADNYSSMGYIRNEVAHLEFLYLNDGKRPADLRNAEQWDFQPAPAPGVFNEIEAVTL